MKWRRKMSNNQPIHLGNRIDMIDLYDLGMEKRTGAYVIQDDKTTIIETSASPSIPHLLKGLEDLHIDPKDIEYIIVTHIHLDHAGGAGLLLKDCPNAKVVVHPRGYRHLVNPSKLIAGAKAVYGDDFDRLFDPIIPIPEDKLIVKEDKETLQIGKNTTLTFYDTPGHSKHHFSIYDPVSNGMFTGDTTGVFYQQLLTDYQIEFYLPSTSPNQFNPDDMLQSTKKIIDMGIDRIYFGHYGMSTNPKEVYEQLQEWMPTFINAGKEGLSEIGTNDFQKLTETITDKLKLTVFEYLQNLDIPKEHSVYDILDLDLNVCAMGIADYLLKTT